MGDGAPRIGRGARQPLFFVLFAAISLVRTNGKNSREKAQKAQKGREFVPSLGFDKVRDEASDHGVSGAVSTGGLGGVQALVGRLDGGGNYAE